LIHLSTSESTLYIYINPQAIYAMNRIIFAAELSRDKDCS